MAMAEKVAFLLQDCGCRFQILSENPRRIKFTPTIDQIPLDCKKTWELICQGNTKGVFQIESSFAQSLVKRFEPKNIEELSVFIAIMRPGCTDAKRDDKSITNHVIDRKHGYEDVSYFHPALKDILKDTWGEIVFQEQAIKIATDIAGFSLEESDSLRKCIASGSIVMTQNGPRDIDFICKNFENKRFKHKILTVDSNNKLIYKNLSHVWKTGKQKVYELVTKKGHRIEVTENHQIYTQNGWKDLKYIDPINDSVLVPDKYIYKGYTKNININQAIILSYMIGGGCYTDKCAPKITNSDKWILHKIRQCLQKEFGKNCYTEYRRKNGCIDFSLRHKASTWIKSIISPARSRDKTIPSEILQAQESVTQAFIGSYFSGEGDVNIKQKTISISTISHNIAKNLQILLLRNKIHSSFHVKSGQYKNEPYISYRIVISDPSDIIKFRNVYKKYICPIKFKKLQQINLSSWKNSRFLVPNCFIKAATANINLNSLLAKPEGGSAYNKNLTYDRVARINQYLNSPLLEDILNAEFKFCQIDKIKFVGEKETYDFTVENGTHCGFINGILVHNSVGKKKPELMAKIKQKFITKAKDQGIVTKEEAEEIFSWIEKSQRYSFNKSHSVCYALNGYLAAYSKAHFPGPFFTSSIHYADSKPKKYIEVKELVENARTMSIDVRAPNFNLLEEKCQFIDNVPTFGLTEIKDFGKTSFKKATAVIEEYGEPKSWIEFLVKYSPRIESSAINGLIYTGALSHLCTERTKMHYEYLIYKQLSNKELEWCSRNYSNADSLQDLLTILLEQPVGKDGGIATKKRVPIVEAHLKSLKNPEYPLSDCHSALAKKEHEYLGVALTTNKINEYNTGLANSTCREFSNNADQKAKIAVIIDDIREHTIKSGKNRGKKMAFVKLSDDTCGLDAMAFSKIWEKKKNVLRENNAVLIELGRWNNDFVINDVLQLELE